MLLVLGTHHATCFTIVNNLKIYKAQIFPVIDICVRASFVRILLAITEIGELYVILQLYGISKGVFQDNQL